MGRDKRDTGSTSRRGRHGNIAALRAQNGKMVCGSKGRGKYL